MKVSIVIPCYNEKATIEKIVEAVRSAAISSREIIIVDDCSQDGTRAVLEEKVSQMVDRIASFFSAYGRQQVFDPAFQHVH